jgi:hypothetical protein
LNALAICSCVWSHHPGHVIIHEREGTPICVDPVLDKIRIKKRNRIGERGGPWGSPACGSARFVDGCPLTTVAAVRPEQNASTHRTSRGGIPRAVSLWSSLSLCTPLYAPFTSKLTRLTTCLLRHAL